MRRRTFILALGGAAAWPLAAGAQQADRIRRIGLLMSIAETDPVVQPRLAVFKDALHKLGWEEGRNVVLEVRFAGPDPARFAELAADGSTAWCIGQASGCSVSAAYVAPEVAEQRIAAAVAAGGTVVDDSDAPSLTVIADQDGNEGIVCIDASAAKKE